MFTVVYTCKYFALISIGMRIVLLYLTDRQTDIHISSVQYKSFDLCQAQLIIIFDNKLELGFNSKNTKKNVNFTLKHAMKAHRGSRGIEYSFLNLGARLGGL